MPIFNSADILLPKETELEKWSVVACDQFTSQPEYWENAAKIAGGAPSALKIIFPEAYLGDRDDERIQAINSEMEKYLSEGLFEEYKDALIYTERTQADGRVRKGVVGAVDLEEYDFSAGSQSPIRATEGTILSRIPPRKKIRENAPLETPHIIMLTDDRRGEIIEPLAKLKSGFKKLYDFDLMAGSGHLRGYLIDESVRTEIIEKITALCDKDEFEKKYGVSGKGVLAIAVGDGNHSLATAKACWEEIKKGLSEEEIKTHPARYALAELENIHDDALEFEPIQRVVFNVNPEALIEGLMKYYPSASYEDNGGQKISFIYGSREGTIYVGGAPSNLPIGTLQKFLDAYITENGGEVDYIHGNDVVRSLAQRDDTVGFMVDKMEKNDLFATVIKDGALPRKTFSMGEAADKRFYLECKKII